MCKLINKVNISKLSKLVTNTNVYQWLKHVIQTWLFQSILENGWMTPSTAPGSSAGSRLQRWVEAALPGCWARQVGGLVQSINNSWGWICQTYVIHIIPIICTIFSYYIPYLGRKNTAIPTSVPWVVHLMRPVLGHAAAEPVGFLTHWKLHVSTPWLVA